MGDIDFVVTWVDFDDPEWRAKFLKYSPEKTTIMNDSTRYKDYGTFKYWFRSIEKYAPWVRKVFLITDNQVPKWLNTSNEKLVIVDHKEFIPKKYLPTFNSNVIELNIPRIKGLSEKFVLFNDDLFLNGPVKEVDFFKNNLPVDMGAFQPTIPVNEFTHIILNDLLIINKWFGQREVLKKNFRKLYSIKYGFRRLVSAATTLPFDKILGFYDGHAATPYLKSTYEIVLEKADESVKKTFLNRFRSDNDINHWLVRYYEYCMGDFEPQKYNFGKFYELDEFTYFVKDIKNSNHKIICINDTESALAEKGKKELKKVFQEKFPFKSTFEV